MHAVLGVMAQPLMVSKVRNFLTWWLCMDCCWWSKVDVPFSNLLDSFQPPVYIFGFCSLWWQQVQGHILWEKNSEAVTKYSPEPFPSPSRMRQTSVTFSLGHLLLLASLVPSTWDGHTHFGWRKYYVTEQPVQGEAKHPQCLAGAGVKSMEGRSARLWDATFSSHPGGGNPWLELKWKERRIRRFFFFHCSFQGKAQITLMEEGFKMETQMEEFKGI